MKTIYTPSYRQKTAMPVPQPPPDIRQKMTDENVYMLHDIERSMPNLGIRELKSLLSGIGGMEGLSLPKIFYPSDKNIVSLNGKPYYFLHYDKAKSVNKLWLLDLTTKQVVVFPYAETVGQLSTSDPQRRAAVRAQANEAIKQWNAKIDTFDRTVGLATIPLRVQRVLKLVDARMQELQAQLRATEQQAQQGVGSGGLDAYRGFLLSQLAEGNMSPQDAIDTLMYLYIEDTERLLDDLNNGSVQVAPQLLAAIRPTVEQIARQHAANRKEDYQQRDEKFQDRQQRIEGDLPEVQEPQVRPLEPVSEDWQPQGYGQKANAYRSPDAFMKQKGQVIQKLTWEIQHLGSVQQALASLNQTIAAAPKLTRDFLATPEGQQIKERLKSFLQAAYGFIKKYERDVFDDQGMVQRNLFGHTGSMGNVELAVEMNRLFNAIHKAIRDAEPAAA